MDYRTKCDWEVSTPYMGRKVQFYNFANAWKVKEMYSGVLCYKGKRCSKIREAIMYFIHIILA